MHCPLCRSLLVPFSRQQLLNQTAGVSEFHFFCSLPWSERTRKATNHQPKMLWNLPAVLPWGGFDDELLHRLNIPSCRIRRTRLVFSCFVPSFNKPSTLLTTNQTFRGKPDSSPQLYVVCCLSASSLCEDWWKETLTQAVTKSYRGCSTTGFFHIT